MHHYSPGLHSLSRSFPIRIHLIVRNPPDLPPPGLATLLEHVAAEVRVALPGRDFNCRSAKASRRLS